jgi:fimbrial chaperone protein
LRAPQTSNKSEVKVLTKMGVPIFVRPGKPAAAGSVEGMGLAKRKLAFAVRNTGNVHFLLQSVRVKALDAKGAAVFQKDVEGWCVLAGGTRVWEVEIPKDVCGKSKVITVAVESAEAKFDGRMEMPAAGCGP